MRERVPTRDDPELPESPEELREKIIGLGERSGRKSFYPELRERLSTLERFRALLDQTHDAILVADVRGGLVSDLNQATCRMLGSAREELLGLPLAELSPAIAERIALAQPGQVVAALRARGGREVPVEATLAFRAEGATHLAVVVARDITERQRSERALRESEERFRAVFEGAAIGIAVVGLDGLVQSTNRALQELLGQSAAELHGRAFVSIIHADDQRSLGQAHDALLGGTHERTSLELRLARADGQVVWAQLSASLVGGDDGSPAHLVAAFQDVTVRRRTQEALEFLARASVRLASSLDVGGTLRNLTELAVPFLGSFCALSATAGEGREHRVVACRDPEQQALGERLLADRSVSELLGAGSWGDAARLIADGSERLAAAAEGNPARVELLRRLDLRTVIFVPLAAGGRSLGTLLLATGRSERRYGPFDLELATEFGHRAAVALENASLLLKAQEANRLKDEFLAIVSHELRTPLTAILGWIGLLQTGKVDPEKARTGLGVVERNARALAQIIDDLLGVSRIMAGKLAIHPAPTDLAPIVESAVDALRPAAEASQVELRTELEPGVPRVMGDASRLQQILWNLLSNAVKYTPEGGQVLVRLRRANDAAEVTVSDTGRGIDPAFLPHVFEAFRQADSSNTRRYGGLGLGLAIVRHLVELHGGTVRAASDGPGRGASFAVTIPLAPVEAAASRPAAEPELPRLPDLRILLVEDDPDTLELLGEILERQGAHVVSAPSARRALSELEREVPDVVISDIAMPEQDGISLLQAIRARGFDVPALALSALSREEDRARALAAGFDSYLVKPVDPGVLLRAVANPRHRWQ